MSRYTAVMASALVWAAALTPALAQGQSGQAGPQVTVNNTAANPVPVVTTGSVDVTAATPLPVAGNMTVNDPALNAYVHYDGATISSGWVNVQLDLGAVPAGKRLVVEYVGAACNMAADDEISRAAIWVTKKAGAGWSSYAAPLGVASKATTSDGGTFANLAQSMRLYSDGGFGNVFVDIWRRNTTNEAQCWAVVSGYTVDVP